MGRASLRDQTGFSTFAGRSLSPYSAAHGRAIRVCRIDIDDDEEEHEGEAMAVDPPPLQNHARVDDDSGDDIDDSLLAGIDMDTIANPAMNEPTQPSAYPTPDGAAVIRHVDKRPRLDTANPDPATQQESLPQRWTSGGSSVATAHSTIKQERKVVRQDAPLVSKVQQQAVEAGPAVDTEPVSKLQSPPKQTKRKQPVPLNQLATALRSGSTQVQVEVCCVMDARCSVETHYVPTL